MLIKMAWRNLWRQPRRTLITAVAMALGLAFCLTMVALVDGVYRDVFDRLVTDSLGHAQIHHPDYPKKRAMWETVPDADALVDRLEALPQIERASARLFGYGLLGTEDKSMGAQLIGVDPASETAMTRLADKIIDGRYLSDGAADEIIVGDKLASKLRLSIGDELIAVTQAADGSTGNDLYTVVGLFHTGSVALDRGGAYVHADDLRELLVLPGQSHEITVLAPTRESIGVMVDTATPVVQAGGSMIRPWTEINPQFAQMMEMADVSGIIMMFFIFGVAALGILNTMLMSVFERTKELGVIRALGLKPSRMFALVMLETFALTIVACLVGLPLGLAGDIWLITSGLDLTGVMDSTSIMGIDYDPVYIGAWDTGHFLQVVIGLFVISFVAAVWPAFRVARLQPVEAMRQE